MPKVKTFYVTIRLYGGPLVNVRIEAYTRYDALRQARSKGTPFSAVAI